LIAAVVITVLLLLGALGVAFGLTWRRYVAQPMPVAAEVEGPTCYPRVKR
jgi:hypothetical protein